MPLVEKRMMEPELREAISRLDRLIEANPAMARDFTTKKQALTAELNDLLLRSGGYEVMKTTDVEQRVKDAFIAGYASGQVQRGLREAGPPGQVEVPAAVETDKPV